MMFQVGRVLSVALIGLVLVIGLAAQLASAQPPEPSEPEGDGSSTAKPNTGSSGINCYRCNSESDTNCTGKVPSYPATQQSGCSNPNKLAKDWLLSHSLNQMGSGNINLEMILLKGEKDVDSKAELKDVSGCAFFYASSESTVTAGVDRAIAFMRNLVGDKNANDSVTVKQYVFRDCVTLKVTDEMRKQADHCVAIPGTKEIMTVTLCVCTSDKCNEGTDNPTLKQLIATAEKDTTNESMTCQQNLGVWKLIFVALICVAYALAAETQFSFVAAAW